MAEGDVTIAIPGDPERAVPAGRPHSARRLELGAVRAAERIDVVVAAREVAR